MLRLALAIPGIYYQGKETGLDEAMVEVIVGNTVDGKNAK
jgi:hypothetical protein